jgi:hypothetical protein
MNRLRFTEKNYNRYDEVAKQKATNFLQSKNFTPIQNNAELYCDGDFWVYNKILNKKFLVEVEVKNVWNGKHFPYPTIHVPTRKSKSKADIYIMFNSDLSCLFVTKMKSILNSKVVYKSTKNKYTNIQTFNEKFFEFSLTNAKFYSLDNTQWINYDCSYNRL